MNLNLIITDEFSLLPSIRPSGINDCVFPYAASNDLDGYMEMK